MFCFFAHQHWIQTFSKNKLMGKVISTHNRKLSILHLFAPVVIQFLSFPLTASFAFSISGVYFLFEDRVTTVIPFVPVLPNGKNKCFLRLGLECFSSFSQRIQPDFIWPKPGQSYFRSVFFLSSWQLNFWTPSEEYDKDNPRRLSQADAELWGSKSFRSRKHDLNGQAAVEFYRSQKSN